MSEDVRTFVFIVTVCMAYTFFTMAMYRVLVGVIEKENRYGADIDAAVVFGAALWPLALVMLLGRALGNQIVKWLL